MLLELGISPCPNDVFIFAGILLGEVKAERLELHTRFEDVETLNRLTLDGDLDVSKISYGCLSRCAHAYRLLPTGSALGRGVGPLLLTNGDPFNANGEIMSPGEFTTANFLLDFYLQRPLDKRYVVFNALYDELLTRPGAQGVVIHEKRFTYERDGLHLVQDLGEHWERETGYPIPLGGIVVRREIDAADRLADLIRSSLIWSYANYDRAFELCRHYSQDLDPAVVKSHIDLYVNEYSLDLGEDGSAAVAFFVEQQRLFCIPA